MEKNILHVDMDNVLVNFQSGIDQLELQVVEEYEGRLDEVPGIFALMDPMEGAVESFNHLASMFDIYILSTAPWENPSAWSDKLLWVKKHLGDSAYKRLTLTHNKNLSVGHFLVDDRTKNGADGFSGEHIHFGTERFPNWESVVSYLESKVTG